MIKVFACIFMLIDHIGLVFFPEIFWFRIIGRLAFPLFAYQVATGLLHTSDGEQYAARLISLGVLSQLPFSLLLHTSALNILFAFGFAVLMVHVVKSSNYFHFFVLCVAAVSIHLTLDFDYGMYGILSVVGFYVIRDSFTPFMGTVVSSLFFCLLTFCFYQYGTVQVFALCAVPLFFVRGNLIFFDRKYFYYAFYPVHLSLLWGVCTLFDSL